MDPLSVTMAILGLLQAGQKISATLSPIISKAKNAPKELKELKTNVDTIRTVLSKLQLMLLGRTTVDRQRTSLILVDQIVVTLSACVSTFSEVDVFVESLSTDNSMGILDRVRWATKTSTIDEHLKKLDMHKASLTLMVTILTCESTYRAEDAVDELSTMVRLVLDSNRLIAERLASIEMGLATDITVGPYLPQPMDGAPQTIQLNDRGFAFEEELEKSWVYKRSISRDEGGAFSIVSSAGRTASWSMLSGLSLADNISIIAVQALPVYANDFANSDLYQFGEVDEQTLLRVPSLDERSSSQGQQLAVKGSKRAAIRKWSSWKGVKDLVDLTTHPTPQGVIIDQHEIMREVFGVDLRKGITYANVAISLTSSDGRPYVAGYIPIIVGKTGVFLKEKGTDCKDIFVQSGSAKRLLELENVFSTAPRYGKGFVWDAGLQDVYCAASILLRFLKLLPEPIVPYAFFDRFIECLGPHAETQKQKLLGDEQDIASPPAETLETFHILMKDLPPLNRQLLFYLLDLLAVFASKSEENLMPVCRLVAAFQPALLSKIPSQMSAEDHAEALNTMAFLVAWHDLDIMIGSFWANAEAEKKAVERSKEKAGGDSNEDDMLVNEPEDIRNVISDVGDLEI